MDYRAEAPEVIKDFLTYHETIKGHSKKTVDEYYLDLRTFFRYLKIIRGIVPRSTELDEISIRDIDIDFVKSVTVSEVYEYLAFLTRDRVKNQKSRDAEYGTKASTRARKVSTLRSFYRYLTVKAKLIDTNPLQDLDVPKIPRTLPRYLTLPEAQALLSSVDGKNKEFLRSLGLTSRIYAKITYGFSAKAAKNVSFISMMRVLTPLISTLMSEKPLRQLTKMRCFYRTGGQE